jgi:hypothetical protein
MDGRFLFHAVSEKNLEPKLALNTGLDRSETSNQILSRRQEFFIIAICSRMKR